MIHVLLDAIPIRAGGGVTHLAAMLPQLDRLAKGMTIHVLCDPTQWARLRNDYHHVRWLDCGEKPVESLWARRRFYRKALPGLIQEHHINVFYAVGGLLPPGIEKQTATVASPRNLLPFVAEELQKYSRLSRGFWRLQFLKKALLDSLRRADRVILISRYGGEVFEQYLPGITQRCDLVYHGISEAFLKPNDGQLKPSLLEPYILYISELCSYKYQIELLHALDLLRREKGSCPHLVLVGKAQPRYKRRFDRELTRLRLADQVTYLGPVGHDRLPALIRGARFCAFSSGIEFCPNIVLEMMACGAPMALSNRGPMPEIAGDSALYYDPANPAEIAKTFAALLDNPQLIDQLGRLAEERSTRFSWSQTAQATMDVLRKVAGEARQAEKPT